MSKQTAGLQSHGERYYSFMAKNSIKFQVLGGIFISPCRLNQGVNVKC